MNDKETCEFSFLDSCGFCGHWPTARDEEGRACILTDNNTGVRRVVCDGCLHILRLEGRTTKAAA